MQSALFEKETKSTIKTSFSPLTYALLSIAGGYFEAYAIINRNGLFANAQTSNFTHIWVSLCDGQIGDFLYHLLPLVLYLVAIAAATALPRLLNKFNWAKLCLLIEGVGVVILGLLPQGLAYRYAILPIFFITALQYQTFQSCGKYASSTIFCTNNLRQMIGALTEYAFDRDDELLKKSRCYLLGLLMFAIGVAAVFVFSSYFGDRSVWFCLLPLCGAYFSLQQKKLK